VNVTFVDWDPNPWDLTYAGPVYMVYYIILLILFSVNIIIIAWFRIFQWIRQSNPFEVSLGFACLCIELCANLVRIIEALIYPLYNYYLLPGADVIKTLPICLSLISGILVVFFWLDLTSDPFYHGKFLGVMKIPAVILMGLCLGIEIIFDFLKTLTTIALGNAIYYFFLLLHIFIIIFSFVAAWRILKKLELKSRTNKKKKITYRIIVSGSITVLGFILIILINTVLAIIENPPAFMFVWTLLFVTFGLQSTVLINIFQGPKIKQKSTKRRTTSTENPNDSRVTSRETAGSSGELMTPHSSGEAITPH